MNHAGSALLISVAEKLDWFRLSGLITLILLMCKWIGSFFEEKSSSKLLGLTFSSKLNWGS